MTDPVSDLITDSMIPRGPVQWAAQTYRIQQGTMKYIESIRIMPNEEKGRGPWRETTEQWFLTWMLYSLLAWAETLGRGWSGWLQDAPGKLGLVVADGEQQVPAMGER